MARNDGSAYDAARREARAIVDGCVESILDSIKAGYIDEDSLHDRIHEECDNALTYTSDQWVCAYGLDEEDMSKICRPESFQEALTAHALSFIGDQAFLNLQAAVSSYDFSEALAVAADAAEETTPEEPREEVTP